MSGCQDSKDAIKDKPGEDSPWIYLALALLCWGLLAMDLVSAYLGKLIDGRSLSDPQVWGNNWYSTAIMLLTSTLIWAIGGSIVLTRLMRTDRIKRTFQVRLEWKQVAIAIIGLIVLLGISLLESKHLRLDELSISREFQGFRERYPTHAALITSIQYGYYLMESFLVLLMIGLFHQAGRLVFGKPHIPWGGIGIMMTWGMGHLVSHPQGAIWMLYKSLAFGVLFVMLRKNPLLTVGLIYWSFII